MAAEKYALHLLGNVKCTSSSFNKVIVKDRGEVKHKLSLYVPSVVMVRSSVPCCMFNNTFYVCHHSSKDLRILYVNEFWLAEHL